MWTAVIVVIILIIIYVIFKKKESYDEIIGPSLLGGCRIPQLEVSMSQIDMDTILHGGKRSSEWQRPIFDLPKPLSSSYRSRQSRGPSRLGAMPTISDDLKRAGTPGCWEPSQLRGLIDNSPTQAAVCSKFPNCSQYMWNGFL